MVIMASVMVMMIHSHSGPGFGFAFRRNIAQLFFGVRRSTLQICRGPSLSLRDEFPFAEEGA
jgi:hypothetical protein